MSAKGGITKGKSHAEGGIPMVVKSTGQKVELEGGEGVINKRNMASTKTYEFEGEEKTICEIASDINSADGNGVQIDCDGITGRKYKHKEGGRISKFKIARTRKDIDQDPRVSNFYREDINGKKSFWLELENEYEFTWGGRTYVVHSVKEALGELNNSVELAQDDDFSKGGEVQFNYSDPTDTSVYKEDNYLERQLKRERTTFNYENPKPERYSLKDWVNHKLRNQYRGKKLLLKGNKVYFEVKGYYDKNYAVGGEVSFTDRKDPNQSIKEWEGRRSKRTNQSAFGSFSHKLHFPNGYTRVRGSYYLYPLNDFDEEFYSHIKLKDGEILARIETDNFRGGEMPLVKINIQNGRVYFMSDDSDEKNPKFDRASADVTYLSLDKDIIEYAKSKGTYRRGGGISKHDELVFDAYTKALDGKVDTGSKEQFAESLNRPYSFDKYSKKAIDEAWDIFTTQPRPYAKGGEISLKIKENKALLDKILNKLNEWSVTYKLMGSNDETPRYSQLTYDYDSGRWMLQSTQTNLFYYIDGLTEQEIQILNFIRKTDPNNLWNQYKEIRTEFLLSKHPTIDVYKRGGKILTTSASRDIVNTINANSKDANKDFDKIENYSLSEFKDFLERIGYDLSSTNDSFINAMQEDIRVEAIYSNLTPFEKKTIDQEERDFKHSIGLYKGGGKVIRARGNEQRILTQGDPIIYKDELWYVSEKNDQLGIVNMSSGAWGSNYPFIPLHKIKKGLLSDMSGNKDIQIRSKYANGGSTFTDTTYIGGKKVYLRYIFDDSMNNWQDEAQAHIDWFSKQGKTAGVVHKGNQHALYVEKTSSQMAKGGYIVWNNTDKIYASPNTFATKKEANDFIKKFRSRYEQQGYYRDNRWNQISPQDIDLVVMEEDESIFSKGGEITVENEDERTTLSLNGIGSIVITETTPEYEFVDDISEDELENLDLYEDDFISKIENLRINDGHKGKGYAKLLMNKALDYIDENYSYPIYLNASPMQSDGMLNLNDLTGFYEKFGFKVFKRQGGNNLMIKKSKGNTYAEGGEILKLRKIISGEYVAKGIVKGHNVEYTISKLEPNGFSYSIYIDGKYVFGDGWVGLRLKDIKSSMMNDIYYAIENKSTYEKGGGIDKRIIRSKDEAHLMSVLIGLGLRAKSPYRPNQSYFGKTDRKKLNEIYDRLNESTYAEGGEIERQIEQMKSSVKAKKKKRLEKELEKAQFNGNVKKIDSILKELSELDSTYAEGGDVKVGDKVVFNLTEYEVRDVSDDSSKIGETNGYGRMVLLSNGQWVNVGEVKKSEFYETWDRFKDDIRTRFGDIPKEKFEDGGEVNMYLKEVFDEYEVFKEGGSVPMISLKNSLGYDKSELPQLRSTEKPMFKEYLDKKYRRKMTKKGSIKASELKPTQNKINPAQIDIIKSVGIKMKDKPISISRDGYVIDGHHRWFHQKMNNDDINYIQYDLPAEELIQEMFDSGLVQVETIESIRK
jgi:GNAT superfamily N-acetyltransferase